MIRAPLIKIGALALALLPISACGFTPVYGRSGDAANAGPITVAEIETTGRAGHVLRQELVRAVGQGVPGIAGPARLEVKLTLGIERLAFTPDQAASRSDYVGTATWTLRNAAGTAVQAGSTVERASFNFADSAYADLAAQTAAQERLATLLARSIRDRMIIAAGKPLDQTQAAPAVTAAAPTGTSVQVIQ